MNKLKRYIIFLIGLFVNSLGVSLITKAKSGNLTNLIDSVCIKLKFSVYARKLYDCFQRIFDLTAVADPA